jgi:quercetin dioxygenase-like cupin family protein
MPFIDHANQADELWRPGVRTRLLIAAATGSAQLCQFEQWCDPGCGAPTHIHAVEEILTVLAGEADVWIGDDTRRLGVGQTALVPAGQRHGFSNPGSATLHVLATLAAPIFEAAFETGQTPRRWSGQPDPNRG